MLVLLVLAAWILLSLLAGIVIALIVPRLRKMLRRGVERRRSDRLRNDMREK